MPSTNKTQNLNLSQFIASDKPAWLTDYNNDMEKIDKGVSASTPPGSVIAFAGTTAPEGFLMCNGQEVSKTDYPALFTVVGTAYGKGSNDDKFKVPNLVKRFPLGDEANLGLIGGEKEHVLTVAEMPSHSHTYYAYNFVGAAAGRFDVNTKAESVDHNLFTSSATGSNKAHNNMPPYITLAYIIKT